MRPLLESNHLCRKRSNFISFENKNFIIWHHTYTYIVLWYASILLKCRFMCVHILWPRVLISILMALADVKLDHLKIISLFQSKHPLNQHIILSIHWKPPQIGVYKELWINRSDNFPAMPLLLISCLYLIDYLSNQRWKFACHIWYYDKQYMYLFFHL